MSHVFLTNRNCVVFTQSDLCCCLLLFVSFGAFSPKRKTLRTSQYNRLPRCLWRIPNNARQIKTQQLGFIGTKDKFSTDTTKEASS
mmetsp:Transcript_3460/g.9171  ORF Transcript_3460/g.9171 Transcript_3460/m.9171 type:complete len:86 (+) Transcript_3460:177-434(+)